MHLCCKQLSSGYQKSQHPLFNISDNLIGKSLCLFCVEFVCHRFIKDLWKLFANFPWANTKPLKISSPEYSSCFACATLSCCFTKNTVVTNTTDKNTRNAFFKLKPLLLVFFIPQQSANICKLNRGIDRSEIQYQNAGHDNRKTDEAQHDCKNLMHKNSDDQNQSPMLLRRKQCREDDNLNQQRPPCRNHHERTCYNWLR